LVRIGRQIAEALTEHFGWDRITADNLTASLWDQVGISPTLARRYPGELSGGQCQRAAIALAIALHSIPEGISVSVSIFYATGDRKKAVLYSLLSGLAEPGGASFGYLAIQSFLGGHSGEIPPQVMGILFSGVAGIMVYISLDELLSTSRAYGRGPDSIAGLAAGMLVMALSLLLMR
jgi:hypothetical protein